MDILNNEFLLFLTCAQKAGLRYLLIGGYAVNFYGYNRSTADMDIWIAPTMANRQAFIDTLLCMKYSSSEVEPLMQEDFTAPFVGTIGSQDAAIDVLTFVHPAISFDEAEKNRTVFELPGGIVLHIVPYNTLKEMKLRTHREKDMFDIARLEEIINQDESRK